MAAARRIAPQCPRWERYLSLLLHPRAMSPPRFEGPTHPCPRCGEVVGRFKGFRAEHLAHVGWRAYQVESYQNWCGHGQEVLTWPQSDGSVLLIPVLGEAS